MLYRTHSTGIVEYLAHRISLEQSSLPFFFPCRYDDNTVLWDLKCCLFIDARHHHHRHCCVLSLSLCQVYPFFFYVKENLLEQTAMTD